METLLLPDGSAPSVESAVARAIAYLEEGEVVALPTETVYGLAGDALNPSAAARIFEAKQRPFFDPLICHLPSLEWLDRFTNVPRGARTLVQSLAARFWPGPLTLVLPRRAEVPDLVSSGLPTVAVRQSAHSLFSMVVERFARPLAAPSANRFGRISPTRAEHVRQELDGRIPMILDGGPTLHGVESTIVAVDADSRLMRVLRSGPVTREQLELFGEVRVEEGTVLEHPEAPGQLKSHYAPRTRMVLAKPSAGPGAIGEKCGLLAWRSAVEGFAQVEVLSSVGDLREAAASLFAKMRRLDDSGLELIVAELVPNEGLGVAINDRLRRASS